MRHTIKKSLAILAGILLGVIPVCAQRVEGTWKGYLDVQGHPLPLVIHVKADAATMDSPAQNASGIPVTINHNKDGRFKFSVPKIMAMYTATLDGDTLTGKFKQGFSTLPLKMVKTTEAARRPQTPKAPYPYTAEEVTFYSLADGAKLTGTLTLAQGENAPVAVLVSGSGQQNRDSEVYGHKPFAVISDYLARHGISTFRYDDRGVGESEGLREDLTVEIERDDARSAIKMLRDRGGFSKYGIIGHSLGGTIALRIAGECPGEADYIVSLAGATVRGDTIMIRQNMQAQPGATREECEAAVQAAIEKGPWSAWLRSFAEYDPAVALTRIEMPVMAINGALDCQVDAALNLGTIKTHMHLKPQDVVKEYPGLNHLFQHCKTGLSEEYSEIEETFSEEVMEDMVKFIMGI